MKRLALILLVLLAVILAMKFHGGEVPTSSSRPVPAVSISTANLPPMHQPVAPQVALPVVAPVPAAAVASKDAANDTPKVKINALLGKTIDLVKANDLDTVFETLITPGDFDRVGPLAKQQMEDSLQIHQGTPELGIWISVLQQMKNLTPTYNDAGDEATYAIQDPTGRGISLRPIILQKIGNEWYFSGAGVLRGVIGFGLAQDPPMGL